ncbi:uncharacterized protein EDB91DRAFT_1245055 [Suillus paluster]|uniref:uncharacterized protein n=1 Tax=Suillus paluster TaxID=48578 RepID=UPI001B876EAD|nr:uncharacterized protein EDB91DRAFT_1245055 [Suillus paluster]KAG1748349.1 hypothetical protein EDB91DRAFT_1245055 [Suillus paluster]
MANPNNIVCQFTEDAFAAEDQICKCPSCRAQINKGQPCFYVATIKPSKPGCNVCAACYTRYEKKSVTSKRPTASQYPSSDAASYHRPDPQTIRQSVNAAQRKLSINPPPVIAVPDWTNAAMGPPPVPRHRAITGPDVAIPTSWQGSAASPIPSRLTGLIGYSSHHGSYAAERLRWVKSAYATPSSIAETIALEILAVHKAGGGGGGNICEGKKDIDAHIDAPGLINLALETVGPKLQAFGGLFSWMGGSLNIPAIDPVLLLAVSSASSQRLQGTNIQDEAIYPLS